MESTNIIPKTVLLIFDNLIDRIFFRRILEARLALNILEASDTSTAQVIIADTRPDLIMVYYWIGQESSIDFVRLLRSQSEFEKLPIIMYIVGDQQKVDEAKNTGVDVVIKMAFDPLELIRTVQSLISST
jgi:PleD family two-component response regulator